MPSIKQPNPSKTNMRSIYKQLRALKNHPLAGGLSNAEQERIWLETCRKIGRSNLVIRETTVRLPVWSMSKFFSTPMAVSVASVVMLTTGFMTTVSASDSIPGETFYNVKILTERAQIKLASLDRKAVLHTEFAVRRLDEVAKLQAAAKNEDRQTVNQPLIDHTLVAYAVQVTQATDSLRELQAEDAESAVVIANDLASSLETIAPALDAVTSQVVSTNSTVGDVQQTTTAASALITDVAVESHETADTVLSASEIKKLFNNQLALIESRYSFDGRRVETLRRVITELMVIDQELVLPNIKELDNYLVAMKVVEKDIVEANRVFDLGGYKTAFRIFESSKRSLLKQEIGLAKAEELIVNARGLIAFRVEAEKVALAEAEAAAAQVVEAQAVAEAAVSAELLETDVPAEAQGEDASSAVQNSGLETEELFQLE